MFCYDPSVELLTLAAADGYVLRYRVWPNAGARATLVLVNGVMSHSLWFRPIAAPLFDAGLELVGADRRGSGECGEARGDAPSADRLVEDLVAIMERHDRGLPIFLLGWCWGAVLALNAVHRAEVAGLILVASGLHPTAEVAARAAERAECDGLVPVPVDESMFTDGEDGRRFIEADAARIRSVTPRFRAAMDRLAIGAAGRLRRLDVPVLGIVASRDRATDSAAALASLDRLDPGLVTKVTLDGSHGLMFDAPGPLAEVIARWIGDRS